MEVQYLVQPTVQIGRIFSTLLLSQPAPRRVVLVSAFVNYQTSLRFKEKILHLVQGGTSVRFIIGIDMGGTSFETLNELNTWNIEVLIVKNRRGGQTFHPKLFIVEYENGANVVIGSHNFTDGGFYTNYECGVNISFRLPEESEEYNRALLGLDRFINPPPSTSRRLNDELLTSLSGLKLIPTEEERRRNSKRAQRPTVGESPFGSEPIPSPEPLSSTIIRNVIETHRPEGQGALEEVGVTREAEIQPTSFYMELHSMPSPEHPGIPGEIRIPLAAREVAKEFWGWQERYTEDVSPRGGIDRIYWNWRSNWQIFDSEAPEEVFSGEVRLYFYENSSDFRFYSRKVVTMGAREGDILKITRLYGEANEFECMLSRIGTRSHAELIPYCVIPVRNSTRHWGYA